MRLIKFMTDSIVVADVETNLAKKEKRNKGGVCIINKKKRKKKKNATK